MTLDVTIGKLIIQHEDEEDIEDVKMCAPVHFDICDKEYTLWTRESFRSGSTGFWAFWMKPYMRGMYLAMRKYPHSNDMDIAALHPFLTSIKNLPKNQFVNGIKIIDDADWDRLNWFRFWSLRAINLYGNEAYILFT